MATKQQEALRSHFESRKSLRGQEGQIPNFVYMNFLDLFASTEVQAKAMKMAKSWPAEKIQTQLEKALITLSHLSNTWFWEVLVKSRASIRASAI